MFWTAIVVAIAALVAAFYFAPKGWRTMVVNTVVVFLTGLSQSIEAVRDALPDEWAVYAVVAVNVMNLVLRWVTTTPVGKQS